ncbi:MAG: hypothetical protein HY590_06470 [Candidatus Omnitrophica bacterium]|nr:hypothetical protein [Candidatus Omnitrophota bacterium]
MNEASFLSEIEQEVSLEEGTILKRAEEASEKILEEARGEAARMEEVLTTRTDVEIRKHKSRILTQESLENRQHLLALKSQFASKTLEVARDQFDALQKGSTYREILKKFLAELVRSLETPASPASPAGGPAGGKEKKVILRVRPEDEKVAHTLLGEISLKAQIEPASTLKRGLELEDGEGRFRIRNTFDSRLERAHAVVMQCLNKTLFR